MTRLPRTVLRDVDTANLVSVCVGLNQVGVWAQHPVRGFFAWPVQRCWWWAGVGSYVLFTTRTHSLLKEIVTRS